MKFTCSLILVLLINLINQSTSAQQLPSVQILQDSLKSSFRGLSVPSDNVVWVSGSNGTVGRSIDAGKSWNWMIVPGFEKRDFRDIEAFDSLTAIIMAVDNPADILKTTDGGKNWKVVFHKDHEGMFLDAMDFDDAKGICIGDPLPTKDSGRNSFFVIHTKNRGDDWWIENVPPTSSEGEAIFAGSGSNIALLKKRSIKAAFITGGVTSNLHFIYSNRKISYTVNIPIIQHKASAGSFSMQSNGSKNFYITGGDYVEYWKDSGNVVYTTNAGKTWKRSSVHGYRSCIIQADKKTFITCGTNGVDISFDGCKTWQLIHGDGAKGKDGFNVCAKSKTGKAVYFAGSGRIGKLNY